MLAGFTACVKRKMLDERITLWRSDKIPYGTFYARENLQRIFPEAGILNYKNTPDPSQPSNIRDLLTYEDDLQNTCFIIISRQVLPDDKEIDGLFNLVNKGAKIFISAAAIDETLLDRLRLKTAFYNRLGILSDSLTVSIKDPVSLQESTYTYPGRAFDNSFSYVDASIATVLGRNKEGKANYVRISYESGGAFYVHLAPLAFTNFFLLHKENKAYYDQALSWIPRNMESVRWDDYFRNSIHGSGKDGGGVNDAFDALRWMKEQPAFRSALLLLLLLLLLIYLFESKRKQRIIPVISPLKNTSLDFVKTIGRMYFQRKDNKDLAYKMAQHFLGHIRSRYNIRTSTMNEEFVQRLAYKSGYDQQAVQELVYELQYALDTPQLSDHALLTLNHKLETFYQYA